MPIMAQSFSAARNGCYVSLQRNRIFTAKGGRVEECQAPNRRFTLFTLAVLIMPLTTSCFDFRTSLERAKGYMTPALDSQIGAPHAGRLQKAYNRLGGCAMR